MEAIPAAKKRRIDSESMSSDSKSEKVPQEKKFESFLDFNPVGFTDDVVNMVEEYLCAEMDTMEAALIRHTAIKGNRDKQTVKKGVDRVHEKLEKRAAKGMDLFELYALQHIFVSPSDLQPTPHREDTKTQAAQEKVDEEIQRLFKSLAEARALRRSRQREIRVGAAQLRTLQSDGSSLPTDLVSPECVSIINSVMQSAGNFVEAVNGLENIAIPSSSSSSS